MELSAKEWGEVMVKARELRSSQGSCWYSHLSLDLGSKMAMPRLDHIDTTAVRSYLSSSKP